MADYRAGRGTLYADASRRPVGRTTLFVSTWDSDSAVKNGRDRALGIIGSQWTAFLNGKVGRTRDFRTSNRESAIDVMRKIEREARNYGRLENLVFMSHGGGGFPIGRDIIMWDGLVRNRALRDAMRRMGDEALGRGAKVVIDACSVGREEKLCNGLARLFGCNVWAPVNSQRTMVPGRSDFGLDGTYRVYEPTAKVIYQQRARARQDSFLEGWDLIKGFEAASKMVRRVTEIF